MRDSFQPPSCLFGTFVVSPAPQSSMGAHHGQEPDGLDHEEREEARRIEFDQRSNRGGHDSEWLQLTVEGELPAETIQALVTDLSEKLSALENAPVDRIQP